MVGAVDEGWFDSRQGHEHVCFICNVVPMFRMGGAMPSISIFVSGVHMNIGKPSGARHSY